MDFLSILIVGCLLGLIPASIAQKKGHNFVAWWFFGAALFIVALPAALMLKEETENLSNRPGLRKCPFCAELVKSEAKICRFCHSELPPLPLDKYFVCPNCKTELQLTEAQRQNRKFECGKCGSQIDLT